MDRFELRLRVKQGQARNAFIRNAARIYAAHGSVPNYLRANHETRIAAALLAHYTAVMPYFSDLTGQQYKSRRRGLEIKRLPFLTRMQEWARTRALKNASAIADTDYADVRKAVDDGLTEGLGTEEIATRIRAKTGMTPFRAATVARTETHAAATYAAIEEARQTSEEIGINLQKEWLPTLDDRTRPEHAAMANQPPIPLDALFDVGGEQMDRPGDPSASAAMTVNCRCALSITESSQ